ncbi:MAG: 1-acyl-sn-glycerol-3-phosphate acyltransferase [Lachnospiraceae bacterium]|nr:1-acyl-sn-glycerol-3-phosphate acyltransferase [Lachnospiraceae bacterium]
MKKQTIEDVKRFDMSLPPRRTKWYLHPLTLLLSLPDVITHRTRIRKTGMENIKPPYILLCNHNAFMDFKVATKAIWPARANYVVAIDGFIGREKLLRDVGCICKRKFTNDLTLVRNLKITIKHGDIAVIYPEARYSLCGTTAVLPESLGKMCKIFGVPVVTLICHGHHVNSPFWNLHDRKVRPTEAELSLLFMPGQLKELSVDEINSRIVERFQYDDHKWLKDSGIRIKYKKRAEGLHKVLYQCPSCKKEYRMATEGTRLFCRECGKSWTMLENGELKADSGETFFSHIPDWYEWERENVRKEVENGTYSTGELSVHVDSLPNAKRYIRIGNGTLVHDMNGFRVKVTDTDGTVREMVKSVPSLYSCHIEYEYLGKYGDCVDLNTLEDTWYVYPHGNDFAVTKMAIATEELYKAYRH